MAVSQNRMNTKSFIWRGLRYGLIASVSGSLAFGIVQTTIMFLRSPGPLELPLLLLLAIFVCCALLLSIVPATLGGGLLAFLLRKDGHLSHRKAYLTGVFLGLLTTAGICLWVGIELYRWLWSNGLGGTEGYFVFTGFALMIGAISGGVVGRALASHLHRVAGQTLN